LFGKIELALDGAQGQASALLEQRDREAFGQP